MSFFKANLNNHNSINYFLTWMEKSIKFIDASPVVYDQIKEIIFLTIDWHLENSRDKFTSLMLRINKLAG